MLDEDENFFRKMLTQERICGMIALDNGV